MTTKTKVDGYWLEGDFSWTETAHLIFQVRHITDGVVTHETFNYHESDKEKQWIASHTVFVNGRFRIFRITKMADGHEPDSITTLFRMD